MTARRALQLDIKKLPWLRLRGKRFLERVSIRGKFYLYAGIVVVLMLAQGGIGFYLFLLIRDYLLSYEILVGGVAIILFVLNVILAVILAVIFSRQTSRRIVKITEAAQRMMKGELDHRLPIQAHDELGQLSAIINTMTDRLEKNNHVLHARAQALARSVERFELISRAVDEAIYEWDIDKGEFIWGDGLTRVFGYRQKDKASSVEWWIEHIHPDDTHAIDASLLDHLARHRSTWKKEYRFKRASGQYAYCQDRGFIEYRYGKPVRMLGSLVDVTREKELERAKDEFISVASHQLRTPLGGIRWNLELMLEQAPSLSKDVHERLEEAYRSTLRMTNLVNDLLDVARIEQGHKAVLQEVEIAEIVQSEVAEMWPLVKKHRLKLEVNGLKNKYVVMVDLRRFREVIQNLLSNSVKYTLPGGKVIVAIEANSKETIVSVADTGLGIPEEDQAKIFSKFFRAHNVLKTETEGNGLGLFVVKSYVESWGGKLWFSSELGKGTTFYLSIPARQSNRKTK